MRRKILFWRQIFKISVLLPPSEGLWPRLFSVGRALCCIYRAPAHRASTEGGVGLRGQSWGEPLMLRTTRLYDQHDFCWLPVQLVACQPQDRAQLCCVQQGADTRLTSTGQAQAQTPLLKQRAVECHLLGQPRVLMW